MIIIFHDLGLGNNFLAMTPKGQPKKIQIYLTSSKSKTCVLKDTIKKVKKTTKGMGENICKL